MSSPLVVRDLSVSFRDRTVLDGVDLVAQPGRRIGLVGENGVGKSTLLRAIARRLPDRAIVTGDVEGAADLVFLGQTPPFRDDHTIAAALEATLRPLREAVHHVEAPGDLTDPEAEAAYTRALEYATDHDAWDAGRRADLAAARLGLEPLDGERRIGTLSGGQRTRLALATIMTSRPTCLLLDEPTNHLDDEAIGVLGEFLLELPGVVLLASHDRMLLDDVCTDLIDLDPSAFGTDGAGGRRFGGGWSEYVAHRDAARQRWEETYAAQQEELNRLRAATRIDTTAVAQGRGPRDNDKFVHAFQGSRVDRAVSRRKRDAEGRLEVAEREQVRKPPEPLRFSGEMGAAGASGSVVQVRDLVVAERVRIDRFDVRAGEKVLVSGTNGSGKSTLLGVLSGRLTATSGEVTVQARSVVELVQDPEFPDPRRAAGKVYEGSVGEEAPSLRELGLLHPRDHARPVGLLSVGQRRRLALAMTIAARPDLLLLDEPTNHLSLTLATELEEAMAVAPSAVVVATHDRWLRRRWAGAEVALPVGRQVNVAVASDQTS